MALRYSAVSEKSPFIQGILLTRISLLNLVRQSIVHVLYEWAKVALDNTGGHIAAQTGLARPIGFALFPTYAEDEWFRYTN
jgi:hypothetical protein